VLLEVLPPPETCGTSTEPDDCDVLTDPKSMEGVEEPCWEFLVMSEGI